MFPLSKEVRAAHLTTLAIIYPKVKVWTAFDGENGGLRGFSDNSLTAALVTLKPTCQYVKKIAYCCGVINMDCWNFPAIDPPAEALAAWYIYIDNLVNKIPGARAGAIISTTNDQMLGVENQLREAGFIPNRFFNASSGNHMTMWTLVLHPEKEKVK